MACGMAGRTGAGKGTVAVHMRRSEKICTALCGIILSGNSWLMIDIDLPGQRKREMVSDSQALFCICTEPTEELSGCVDLVAKDVLDQAVKAYKSTHKGVEIKTIELYIVANEGAAYYVVNGEGNDDFKIML